MEKLCDFLSFSSSVVKANYRTEKLLGNMKHSNIEQLKETNLHGLTK